MRIYIIIYGGFDIFHNRVHIYSRPPVNTKKYKNIIIKK